MEVISLKEALRIAKESQRVDKKREYDQKYDEINKEKRQEYQKKWYQENKTC